uniref:Ribosomal protein S6 n=1 Tax=Picea sitchensis TaxID=3332 RepID=A9NNZ1_PICSI|nr:unknown [Picea sitchensis]ABK26832.1 unknown [Picea sitchensis]
MAVSSIGHTISSSHSLLSPPLCSAIARRPQFRGVTIPKICRIEKLKSNGRYPIPTVCAMSPLSLDFKGAFFEGGGDNNGLGSGPLEELGEEKSRKCPPGLRDYETMAVLRPDISEEERLALTQRYEEIIVAGGGMGVEVFNRGMIPLAYAIKKKNLSGKSNTYLDGVYLLFTYFTKPESIPELEKKLKTDDDVIRSSTFKANERKY